MTGPANADGVVDAEAGRIERSLARSRLILLAIAFVVPAGLHLIFERQARRLDALGARGVVTEATVTRVSEQGSETYVDYAYSVDGVTHTWNVAQKDVPGAAVGETFPVVYSPDDPALSRPGSDRAIAATEAASNRSFAKKAVGGIFAFFAFNALICEVRLRRLRKTGQTERTDPQAYRTRLVLTGVMLVPMLVLIFGWHLSESLRQGESVWPVVFGVVGSLGVLGGTGFYVLREGREQASARSARVLRWAAPLATGIAALRLLAWLMGWQ
jgi:hypothetical protein